MTDPGSWPPEGLEQVNQCPICGSDSRHVLHKELTDRVFFVAPGKWTMWQCSNCGSAYLDPRPNEVTIGLAYRQYYTHSELEVPAHRSLIQRFRASLANDYRNSRYGARLTPSIPLGKWIAKVLKPLAGPIDVAFRYLPRPVPGQGRRLLDVGCGNGSFLQTARAAGWDAVGVEPDPISRQQTQERGFEVRDSVGDWRNEAASFKYVTISHVIEHVHDPIELLSDCFALLGAGGGLFIDTPNITSTGHGLYGRNWLHLDPPRHLMLFNQSSLADTVSRAGFERLQFHRRPDALRHSAKASRRIATGLDPFSDDVAPAMLSLPAGQLLQAKFSQRHAEFLTLTAIKPDK